ncbi:MAG: hypothetical protein R3B93_06780, partial [Bacteroidia bacterium]
MKKITLVFLLALLSWTAKAQYDTLSVQELQMVAGAQLAACNDSSAYIGDTVFVYGTVVMDPGLAQAAGGRN